MTQDRLAPHTNIHAGPAASLLLGHLQARTRGHGLGSPAAQPLHGGRGQVSLPRDTLCLHLPSTRVRGGAVPLQGRGGQVFWQGDLHSSRDAQLNNCWCQDKKTEMFRCTRRSENQKKSVILHTKVNQNKDLRSRYVRNSRSNAGETKLGKNVSR